MPAVLIGCPYAEWFVPTGHTADRLEELQDRNVLRRCPECGQDHEWTPSDARIAVRSAALIPGAASASLPVTLDAPSPA